MQNDDYSQTKEAASKGALFFLYPMYTGGLFHCSMLEEIDILGVSGLFCRFYSIFDAKSS